jgi:hypothetical protein
LRALRDHHVRRRRLLAGTLALVVAVAGSYAAVSAFRERSAIVPITSAQPTSVPDLAVVKCDGQDTAILVGAVAARPEGVHVEVINTSDRTLAFNASDTDEFHDVPPGTSTFVESFFFSPGSHFVACGPGGRLAGGFTQQIRVVDPNGAWSPTDLVCPGDEQWGHQSSLEGANPFELARVTLADRVREGDNFRFAGYPESPSRRVVLLVRGGDPIAEVWMDAHDGRWRTYLVNGCP